MKNKNRATKTNNRFKPFASLNAFYEQLSSNPLIDLIHYSDELCQAGYVSVYLKATQNEAGFGGGTIPIQSFFKLRDWITETSGRNITFRGHLKQQTQKTI